MNSQQGLIWILAVAGLLLALATTATAQTTRPNILWVIADDLGVELGCYGDTSVQTPNIDGLASKGLRFTHAFTTAPVCSASRSALITGMYQTSIGAHHHRSHRMEQNRRREYPSGIA